MSAVWDDPMLEGRITFDMDLQPVAGGLDVSAWKLRHGPGPGQFEHPDAGIVSGNQVILSAFPSVLPTSVEYDPPPFQIVGAPPNDQPAQAFVMPMSTA